MINVTRPFLPPLEELLPKLEAIWESRNLSNGGPFALELEEKLSQLLGGELYVSLFCNATVALMVAQRVLGLKGEIITPAYSFAATSHAIDWMGNTPCFADIDPRTLTLCPKSVEEAVSEHTVGIMPLHCYGSVCDVEGIATVAERHSLKIIYDACHSFGTEDAGGSVFRHGDISVVSFHATKTFNTFEGGMLVCKSHEMKQQVDRLKNFGFVDEVTVDCVGINGKMTEFSAAIGLSQLDHLDWITSERKKRDSLYRQLLGTTIGIKCFEPNGLLVNNYSYFPIFITPEFPVGRDELYELLKAEGINARRYFYPLISEFKPYAGSTFAATDLEVSTRISHSVLCLPLYPDLPLHELERVCGIIQSR